MHRHPWINKPHFEGLLIVGEAHYGLDPADDNADATIRIIQRVISGCLRHPFFTKIAQVVTGAPANKIDHAAFWNTVAFHNFVQTSVDGPRKRPSVEQWAVGHEVFLDVVREVEPTHILVLGKCLMRNLPPFDGTSPPMISSGERQTQAEQVGCYQTEADHLALAMEINHPSWPGFSATEWHPLVREFLQTQTRPL